jgi:LUD domain
MSTGRGALAPDRAALDGLRSLRARTAAKPDLLEETLGRMQSLGFETSRCADWEALIATLLRIIPEDTETVYHPCVAGRLARVDQALRDAGRRVVVLPGDGDPHRQNGEWRDRLLSAQFGITGANAMVADSGTLVLAEDSGFGRAASNVPPVHIALVTGDRVVENLLDAAEVGRAYAALHLNKPVPRYLSLISGPSKTADIGLHLVRGMHGPKQAYVLVLDLPGAGTLDDAGLKTWVLP